MQRILYSLHVVMCYAVCMTGIYFAVILVQLQASPSHSVPLVLNFISPLLSEINYDELNPSVLESISF